MKNITLGVWAESSCDHLAQVAEEAGFTVVRIPSYLMQNAVLSRQVVIGLVPTLSILREPDFFSVLPGVGFSSESFVEAEIALRDGLEGVFNIKRIAIDPHYPQEVVMTRIVLQEHYGVKAKFVPVPDLNAKTMYEQSEAALIMYQNVGEETLALDLGLEWLELTMYPMMWGLFATMRDTFDNAQAPKVQEALIAAGYDTDAVAMAGFNAFIESIFFHGVLDELPDVSFIEMPKEAQTESDEESFDRLDHNTDEQRDN
jgi:predicted solute-binding protein